MDTESPFDSESEEFVAHSIPALKCINCFNQHLMQVVILQENYFHCFDVGYVCSFVLLYFCKCVIFISLCVCVQHLRHFVLNFCQESRLASAMLSRMCFWILFSPLSVRLITFPSHCL